MKEVVLGLLGLGNIGGGVWDLIREFGDETARRTGVRLRVKKALVLVSVVVPIHKSAGDTKSSCSQVLSYRRPVTPVGDMTASYLLLSCIPPLTVLLP